MPNYENGKVYMLCSEFITSIYIGSTTQPLYDRMKQHERDYRRYVRGKSRFKSSYELIRHGRISIHLLENYPCENRKEVEKREGCWIEEMKTWGRDVVNKLRAGVDIKSNSKEYMRDYREKNQEKFSAYQREYYQRNREKLKAYQRDYKDRKKNKTTILNSPFMWGQD